MDPDVLLAAMQVLWGLIPQQYLGYAGVAVAVASIADAVIPQPAAGSAWVIPRKVISRLGVNFGHAANAKQAGDVTAGR